MKTRSIALVLCIVLMFTLLVPCLSGCGVTAGATDLMSGIRSKTITASATIHDYNEEVIDFSVRLFQNCVSSNAGSMISPISVLCALAITANGADGDTFAQMEEVIGGSIPELNEYLSVYMKSLPSDRKNKLSIANSIWFKDDEGFIANKDFLQLNADYYNAAIYKSSFDDNTLKAINSWVKTQTDGMIENILDRIPPLAVMYLINAMAFDAEWQTVYQGNQVRLGTFTAVSGNQRHVNMMYSSDYAFLDDGNATGFIKNYSGGRYAFAAMLPNDGVDIYNYVAAMTGQSLYDTLGNTRRIKVNTAIPKFESEYSLEMSDVLAGMGISDAFDMSFANLTKLGSSPSGNLYISRVLHKTFISMDERGTKAGSSTVAQVQVSSTPAPEEAKTVYLDRPFVYMIIDLDTRIPLFIGTVLDI